MSKMKIKGKIFLVLKSLCLVLIGYEIGFAVGLNKGTEELEVYENYFDASQDFLYDELDREFNWVDGFDPMEFYDAEWKIKRLRKEVK